MFIRSLITGKCKNFPFDVLQVDMFPADLRSAPPFPPPTPPPPPNSWYPFKYTPTTFLPALRAYSSTRRYQSRLKKVLESILCFYCPSDWNERTDRGWNPRVVKVKLTIAHGFPMKF